MSLNRHPSYLIVVDKYILERNHFSDDMGDKEHDDSDLIDENNEEHEDDT
jgi:hypothetical protein